MQWRLFVSEWSGMQGNKNKRFIIADSLENAEQARRHVDEQVVGEISVTDPYADVNISRIFQGLATLLSGTGDGVDALGEFLEYFRTARMRKPKA